MTKKRRSETLKVLYDEKVQQSMCSTRNVKSSLFNVCKKCRVTREMGSDARRCKTQKIIVGIFPSENKKEQRIDDVRAE